MREIPISGLSAARHKGTLFEILKIVDYRTTADLKRSVIPDEQSWRRIVAVGPDIESERTVRKADGTRDNRFNAIYVPTKKLWPINDFIKIMKRAVLCGDCTDGSDSDNFFIIESPANIDGEWVPAAYMLDFSAVPLYLEGGYDDFFEAVEAVIALTKALARGTV